MLMSCIGVCALNMKLHTSLAFFQFLFSWIVYEWIKEFRKLEALSMGWTNGSKVSNVSKLCMKM